MKPNNIIISIYMEMCSREDSRISYDQFKPGINLKKLKAYALEVYTRYIYTLKIPIRYIDIDCQTGSASRGDSDSEARLTVISSH
jgi:hypothetical protein